MLPKKENRGRRFRQQCRSREEMIDNIDVTTIKGAGSNTRRWRSAGKGRASDAQSAREKTSTISNRARRRF